MIGEGKFHSSPTSIGAGFLESNLSNVLFYNYYIRYSDESIIVVVVLIIIQEGGFYLVN